VCLAWWRRGHCFFASDKQHAPGTSGGESKGRRCPPFIYGIGKKKKKKKKETVQIIISDIFDLG
jgi:hypothetical protein